MRKKKSFGPKEKVRLIAKLASAKKAQDLVILEMTKIVNFCDYFVICSGSSDRRIRSIAEGIQEGLSKKGFTVGHIEGSDGATWVLLDLGSILVHIFDEKARAFYDLEHLWQEAPRLDFK